VAPVPYIGFFIVATWWQMQFLKEDDVNIQNGGSAIKK